jgi:hypothetical protein
MDHFSGGGSALGSQLHAAGIQSPPVRSHAGLVGCQTKPLRAALDLGQTGGAARSRGLAVASSLAWASAGATVSPHATSTPSRPIILRAVANGVTPDELSAFSGVAAAGLTQRALIEAASGAGAQPSI